METLFLLMKKNKSKEIQGKNVLSFTKFVLGGFWLWGVLSRELLSGVYVQGFCPGGFCPDTTYLTERLLIVSK